VQKNLEQVQRIVRTFVDLPLHILDLDQSGKAMKRWGILNLAALPSGERVMVLKSALRSMKTEPEFLARAVVLCPFAEIENLLPAIYERAGGWLKNEVRSIQLDDRKRESILWESWSLLDSWLAKQKRTAPPAWPLKGQREVRRTNWGRLFRQALNPRPAFFN
jgi:hypothetical protein